MEAIGQKNTSSVGIQSRLGYETGLACFPPDVTMAGSLCARKDIHTLVGVYSPLPARVQPGSSVRG